MTALRVILKSESHLICSELEILLTIVQLSENAYPPAHSQHHVLIFDAQLPSSWVFYCDELLVFLFSLLPPFPHHGLQLHHQLLSLPPVGQFIERTKIPYYYN